MLFESWTTPIILFFLVIFVGYICFKIDERTEENFKKECLEILGEEKCKEEKFRRKYSQNKSNYSNNMATGLALGMVMGSTIKR